MPFVPLENRDAAISGLPLGRGVARLALGLVQSPLLEVSCQQPHQIRYDSAITLPGGWDQPGSTLVPLWETAVSTVCARPSHLALEFLDVPFDGLEERIVARSSTGLLAYVLLDAIETLGGGDYLTSQATSPELEALTSLANELGYSDVSGLIDFHRKAGGENDYLSRLDHYTRSL